MLSIAGLSLGGLPDAERAVQRKRAGAAAGFLSGAAAALVYSLHCPELAAPFLVLWYPLGMLIPAAAGAIAGPQMLRW